MREYDLLHVWQTKGPPPVPLARLDEGSLSLCPSSPLLLPRPVMEDELREG